MSMKKNQQGLVLSGIALLLIMPAILLSASYLTIIQTGGETAVIQSTAEKVHNTGLNIENTIKWMWYREGVPVDNVTMNRFEKKYENRTGLEIEITHIESKLSKIHILVQDPLGKTVFEDDLNLKIGEQ